MKTAATVLPALNLLIFLALAGFVVSESWWGITPAADSAGDYLSTLVFYAWLVVVPITSTTGAIMAVELNDRLLKGLNVALLALWAVSAAVGLIYWDYIPLG